MHDVPDLLHTGVNVSSVKPTFVGKSRTVVVGGTGFQTASGLFCAVGGTGMESSSWAFTIVPAVDSQPTRAATRTQKGLFFRFIRYTLQRSHSSRNLL